MIRSILTLQPRTGRSEEIVRLYRAQEILQQSLDLTRAICSEISVAIDGSGEIIVSALWPDAAAYQEWIDHPERGKRVPQLPELLEGAEVGVAKLYRVDHGVGSESFTDE
ncbi:MULTISPECIES: hypothetical protein [Leucobacter]|uniref:Antibiotic biosynthesis monooxygenase n=1 Tax=Leucobacter manosquensis TaxID=2810611 RepID=A0ABS5M0C2_9MICO|nr:MULTISPECIES: hypothetical protein [Leucobacter]MBS3180632.1 hypothetical protein [Leucobacter manosquensis]